MEKQLKLVEEFQKVFGQLVNQEPTLVDKKISDLRYELMREENKEYKEAVENNDLVGIADALGDELYILLGTINTHGMQHIIGKVFNEINASNMSKLDVNGKPIINGENGVFDKNNSIGKVLKSPEYFKPNLAQFINKF